MSRFSIILRQESDQIWQRIFTHPFLVELSKGILPAEKFRYYLKQDHAFLFDFCRFLGLAIPRCETNEQIEYLSEILHSEFNMEIDMQRNLAKKIGLSVDELASVEMAPTALAYTSFLFRAASTGSVGEIFAAMAPCPLSYVEIAAMLDFPNVKQVPAYSDWLGTYRSEEARALYGKLQAFLDDMGLMASATQRQHMIENFMRASRYEYLFWEMAYSMEVWPV